MVKKKKEFNNLNYKGNSNENYLRIPSYSLSDQVFAIKCQDKQDKVL